MCNTFEHGLAAVPTIRHSDNIARHTSEVDCQPMGRRVGSTTREPEQVPGTAAQKLREPPSAPVCGGNIGIDQAIVNMEKKRASNKGLPNSAYLTHRYTVCRKMAESRGANCARTSGK